MAPRSKDQPPDWKTSIAKQMLRQAILEGKVPATMKPHQVYTLPELKNWLSPYPYNNFVGNLRRLRQRILEDQNRATADYNAMLHDLELHPRELNNARGYPRWDGSEAQDRVKRDVAEGKHNICRISQLAVGCLEFQAFPPEVIRKHYEQEINRCRQKAYWLNQKSKKSKKEENKYVEFKDIVDDECQS